MPPDISIDKIFRMPLFPKGLISILYTTILSLCSSSDQTLLELWSQDLGMDLTMVWDLILGRVHSSSVCARHGVIQCKLLHRVYWTKARLSRVLTLIHFVTNAANTVARWCIRFGHVPLYIHFGVLYSLLSQMCCK